MSTKDIFVAVGIVLTAAIGLLNLGYSFSHNRRSSYVNSVTSARLQWIANFRDLLSRFIALSYELAKFPPTDTADRQKISAEIAQLRTSLRLHLVPKVADRDRDIEREIENLYSRAWTTTEIETELDNLVASGQSFLWNEWLKVKKEAIHGDPYTSARRFVLWLKHVRARRLRSPP